MSAPVTSLPARRTYPVPREQPLPVYLLVAAAILAGAVGLGRLLPEEKLAPLLEVELGVGAVENEPPPPGDSAASAGEAAPEPPPVPETTPPPAPEVPPKPEPPPVPAPQFIVPEERAPATPRPRAPAPSREKPRRPVPASTSTTPAGSGEAGAEAGVRGSPGGSPGGRGGGRGDFIATPTPQYDETARERRYQGHGVFSIRYQNGQITGVSVAASTGAPYLDARTTTWIQARWRVKAGVSGIASLPVTWQLR